MKKKTCIKPYSSSYSSYKKVKKTQKRKYPSYERYKNGGTGEPNPDDLYIVYPPDTNPDTNNPAPKKKPDQKPDQKPETDETYIDLSKIYGENQEIGDKNPLIQSVNKLKKPKTRKDFFELFAMQNKLNKTIT